MKTLTLALAALIAALVMAPLAWAPPQGEAIAIVSCDGQGEGGISAQFEYVFTGPQNLTATQTISVDGAVVASKTHSFTGSSADVLSAPLPSGPGPFAVVASTTVVGGGGEVGDTDSASVTCKRQTPPPPCETNCNPPPPEPFCESHPHAAICQHNPPPPCEGAECSELPETDTGAWYEDPWKAAGALLTAALALLGTAGYLLRKETP